jgi:carbamoyltransferase
MRSRTHAGDPNLIARAKKQQSKGHPAQKERPDTSVENLPNFALFDNAKIEVFRKRLRALRTEEAVARRLQLRHVAAITPPKYPVYEARLQQRFDGLAALISLFLLESEVRREAADDALTSDVVDELLRAGLAIPASKGAIAATLSIYPCSGCYFVTDHRFAPVSHNYYQAPDQPVMHLGPSSYALAHLATRLPLKARVLDLCAGSGIHTISTASKARHSIGVDLNPRAVEFARFNAALNGVARRCHFLLRLTLRGPSTIRSSGRAIIRANPR